MGLFLETVVMLNCTKQEAKRALEQVEMQSEWEIISSECSYLEREKGVHLILNKECSGHETLAEALSRALLRPVMLLYIYDGDQWGYYFYENGLQLDHFNPMPDYFGEVAKEERDNMAGNAALIASYFGISVEEITKYLRFWIDDMSSQEKAYPDDEFDQGYCWQMADFMRKIGFPYEEEENTYGFC